MNQKKLSGLMEKEVRMAVYDNLSREDLIKEIEALKRDGNELLRYDPDLVSKTMILGQPETYPWNNIQE